MKNNHFFNFKNLLIIFAASFLFITITGCVGKFHDRKQVVKSVKKLGDFEEVDFGWSFSGGNEGSYSYISITLLNGKDIPQDKVELERIAKNAAQIIFTGLERESRRKYDGLEITIAEKDDESKAKKRTKGEFKFDMDEL